ncbi:hypothetical protein BJX76DRAFT_157559 [Aspergillus varians]
MLEAPSSAPQRKRSQSLERGLEEPEPETKDFLKTPRRQRSRSLSTERIAQRAAEKVSNYSRDASSKRRADKSRGIAADQQEVESKSPRRRRYPKDEDMASPESSLLSTSAVSSRRRSGDQNSFRTNTSKSSLNNPKLLETVEDAIRRLILPELKELKKDQKVMTNTSKFERDMSNSYSPASSESRDGLVRRLSKHASAPNVRKPKVVLNKDSRDEGIVLADGSVSSQKERRESRDSVMTSDTSYFKGLQPEPSDHNIPRRQRSKGLQNAEKAGIVGSRLTMNNLEHHDSRSSLDKYDEQKDSKPKNINETELVFQKHNVAPITVTKHMGNYTDGSESDFIEKANQGRPVAEGAAVNPRFIHPAAVESAVASVLDPSILDTKSNQSNQSGGSHSHSNTFVQNDSGSTRSLGQLNEPAQTSRQGSPLKQRQDASSPDETSFPRRMGVTSPPQSVTQSLDDLTEPVLVYPDEHAESEINTNPSIIQGPIGGVVAHDSAWPYNQSSAKGGQSPLFDNVGPAAAAGAGAGLGLASSREAGYGHDYYPEDGYGADTYGESQYMDPPVFSTPPGAKDEGYVSAANPISPSPEPGTKGFGDIDHNGLGLFDSPTGAGDSFGPSHQRHFSGYSHGVGSPLYDNATGRGIERIQSKDIVALMDHLTVRDAQRNARDTEILVTLVRSATEMRTSFEEMKKFIAQQDGMLLNSNERHHERTYKAIGGPRPLPGNGSRSTRQASVDDGEDLPAKRKNLFKRALKGLSLKSGNDLSRIEEMLEQLLDEMDVLRAGQDDMLRSGNRAPASVDPDGYEPEGIAGTSSPGDNSGFLSSSSRAAPEPRGPGLRRDPDTRVSTVPEADEDEEIDERGEFLSPQLPLQETARTQRERAGSAPLSTPPRGAVASGALSNSNETSNETTPKTNEKSRKHKSSSSSFFPKISRWSKTTASSMGDNIRNSMQPARKERVSFDTSRSGSDLGHGAFKAADYYDPQGDDRIRSNYTLDRGSPQQENRPPSPLVPSQVSEAPKYRAHRDSLDMQHPQPRQGPTGRYQSQLESQAQIYGTPSGNPSDQWGSNPSFSALNGNRRSSGGSRLSPISDAGYSETSARSARSARSSRQGPPRPPKVKDEGPLFPDRPAKVKEGGEQSYADRVASRSSAMQSPHNTPPARKPTGPRPLNSGSQYNSPNRRRKNYRDSPEQVDDEHDY